MGESGRKTRSDNGRMFLIAVGDRAAKLAWFSLSGSEDVRKRCISLTSRAGIPDMIRTHNVAQNRGPFVVIHKKQSGRPRAFFCGGEW